MQDSSILSCINIGVTFEGFQALKDVNLHFHQNEVHALIGPNGAGKTTIIDVITGKTAPTKGKIIVDKSDITNKPINKISRHYGIGRKFQGANVFDELTVYDNMFISYRKYQVANILKSLFVNRNSGRKAINKVLNDINLQNEINLPAYRLSHGQKQWLEIGMVMLQKPKIIILDEPAAGMTQSETEKTESLIKRLAKHFSLIVVEHDMDFIKKVSDIVTVLSHGQVICEGSYEKVKNDPKVRSIYLETES